MSIDINLLDRTGNKNLYLENALTIVRSAAVITTVITISVCILAFILMKNSSLESLAAQELSLTNKLAIFHGKTGKVNLIHDRLTRIAKLTSSQFSFEKVLDTVIAQTPSDVTISSIAINKDSVALTLSSDSVVSLQEMSDNFTKLIKAKKTFKKMTFQGIVSDAKSGIYSTNISLDLL